jgi:methyltransferase
MPFQDVNIDIPVDRLIPRVPQRVNYVLWVEDLIEKKADSYGIDIGCGSSCIYALIACSLNKTWKMLVSDIDQQNIEYATNNIEKNNLTDRIKSI